MSPQALSKRQFVTCELKGDDILELALHEKLEAKLCRKLHTNTRAERAILLALLQEGFAAVAEGADPEAIARVIRSEVSYECVR